MLPAGGQATTAAGAGGEKPQRDIPGLQGNSLPHQLQGKPKKILRDSPLVDSWFLILTFNAIGLTKLFFGV